MTAYDSLTENPELKPVPACAECKFATAEDGVFFVLCQRYRVIRTSYAYGTTESLATLTSHARESFDLCGPEGRGFQPRACPLPPAGSPSLWQAAKDCFFELFAPR